MRIVLAILFLPVYAFVLACKLIMAIIGTILSSALLLFLAC